VQPAALDEVEGRDVRERLLVRVDDGVDAGLVVERDVAGEQRPPR
jgi:hypothetical protein